MIKDYPLNTKFLDENSNIVVIAEGLASNHFLVEIVRINAKNKSEQAIGDRAIVGEHQITKLDMFNPPQFTEWLQEKEQLNTGFNMDIVMNYLKDVFFLSDTDDMPGDAVTNLQDQYDAELDRQMNERKKDETDSSTGPR